MKFKQNLEIVESSDLWYDLTDGGYIDPVKMLEQEDAIKVSDAIETIQQFFKEAQEIGLLEEL